MPVSPGGILPRDMNARQWSEFLTQSGIQADRTVKSFTPTWSGFSVDPSGSISYMDFGAIVIMWRTDNLLGTSDATSMSLAGVPRSLWPDVAGKYARCYLVDNSILVAGNAQVSGNTITFSLENVSGTNIISNNFGFTAAGSKGIPLGWLIVYAK